MLCVDVMIQLSLKLSYEYLCKVVSTSYVAESFIEIKFTDFALLWVANAWYTIVTNRQ